MQSRHYYYNRMLKWDVFYLSFQKLRANSRWHPVLDGSAGLTKGVVQSGSNTMRPSPTPVTLKNVTDPFPVLLVEDLGF